jgi:hypothetical protein
VWTNVETGLRAGLLAMSMPPEMCLLLGFLLSDPDVCTLASEQVPCRLHREHDGKREVVVYDYVDRAVPVLARMAEKREKGACWNIIWM